MTLPDTLSDYYQKQPEYQDFRQQTTNLTDGFMPTVVKIYRFMNVEDIRNYCLSLKGAEECFPFDDETLVFKALGKMFAFIPLEESDLCINLKCNPEKAVDLREKYQAVQPGYHMNKKYWNTVTVTGEITEKQLKDWIKHSYNEVMRGISKKQREIFA